MIGFFLLIRDTCNLFIELCNAFRSKQSHLCKVKNNPKSTRGIEDSIIFFNSLNYNVR